MAMAILDSEFLLATELQCKFQDMNQTGHVRCGATTILDPFFGTGP